jgi:MFS family permease
MHMSPTPRRVAPVLLLGLAAFLSQFDVTALAVALPTIRHALNLDTAGGAWVIDTYSLAFAGALLPGGFLADGWGRRRVLLTGLVIFAAASAGCALANDGAGLWAWRGVQGVGAALLTCTALAMLSGLYKQREDRMWAFGWIGTIVGVALIVGPAGGGFLANWLGWQSIFWVNPPICIGLFAACQFWLEEQRGEIGSRAGVALILAAVVAIVGLVWSLLEGGHRGWSSAIVIVPGAASLALLLALLGRLARIDTLTHVQRGFLSACAMAALLSIAYWATLVYLPLAGSQWFRIDPAQTGLLLLAATAPMLLLPRFGAAFARRYGLGLLFATGMSAVALGDVLVWYVSTAPEFFLMLSGMILAGSGAGLMNAQLSGAFAGLALPEWAGMASALGITMRQLGYALGIALLGAGANVGATPFAASFIAAGIAAAIGVIVALRMPRGPALKG